MNNQTLAICLVAPLITAFCAGAFGFESDGLYTFLGIAMIFFGTWGAVRLYKTPDAK